MFPLGPPEPTRKRKGSSGPIRSGTSGGAPKAKAKSAPLPLPPPSLVEPGAPDPPPETDPDPPVVPEPPVEVDDGDDGIMMPAPIVEPPRASARRDRRGDWTAGLDGALVRFEPYITPAGENGDNWVLACPRCGGDCHKSRGITDEYTRRFGAIEPRAFLHAWIPVTVPAGAKRKTHRGQFPTKEAVAAYAVAHRKELEEIAVRCGVL